MGFFSNTTMIYQLLSCAILCTSQLIGASATNGKSQVAPHAAETAFKWKNYSYAESGFSIDLPKAPEHTEQSIDIPKSNLKIYYETYLSEPSDTVVMVVSVWNYPAQIDMSNPETNLRDGFNGMLSALPGSDVESMRITDVQGFKALEFLVKNEDIYFQGELVLVYNTLYQVFTVYKEGEEMKANYDRFISSFKLIDPEQHKVSAPAGGTGSQTKVKL